MTDQSSLIQTRRQLTQGGIHESDSALRQTKVMGNMRVSSARDAVTEFQSKDPRKIWFGGGAFNSSAPMS